jgi:hypothetical protein
VAGDLGINERRGKQMTATFARIDDVHGLIAASESVADERKQHAIGFVIAVEERADMMIFIKSRTSKLDSFSRLGHHLARVYSEIRSPLMGTAQNSEQMQRIIWRGRRDPRRTGNSASGTRCLHCHN